MFTINSFPRVETVVVNSNYSPNANNPGSDPNNSTFIFPFNQNIDFTGAYIGLSQFQCSYAWNNTTSAFNNNTFSYKWIDGTTRTINLGNSFNEVSGLNLAMLNDMVSQNYYLINSQGNFVYYIAIQTNSSNYAVEIICNPVPTAAQASSAGLTQPAGASWAFPVSATTPQFIVPNTNFQQLIGFSAGTYPSSAQSTIYSILSNVPPPIITPISNVYITIDIMRSGISLASRVIQSISAANASSFGGLIEFTNNPPLYQELTGSSKSQMVVQFVNSATLQPITLLDNSTVSMTFSIIFPKDNR